MDHFSLWVVERSVLTLTVLLSAAGYEWPIEMAWKIQDTLALLLTAHVIYSALVGALFVACFAFVSFMALCWNLSLQRAHLLSSRTLVWKYV